MNEFLKMSGREVLHHAGTVSHDQAMQKALQEYEIFHAKQLDAPSKAEQDFLAAEVKLKKIAASRRRGKK